MKLEHPVSGDDLLALVNKYADDPLFLLVWHSIKFEMEKSFPNTKLFLYSYQSADSVLLFGYKKNLITRLTNNFIKDVMLLYRHGELGEEEFHKAFADLCDMQPLPDSVIYIGEEYLTKMVSSYYMAKSFNVQAYPNKLFYMNSEQMNTVQDLPLPVLPPGYEIGCADPELDAEVITKTWIHSGPNEEEQTRAKIRCFPSTCVRYDNMPVGFEMVDHNGALNHLFVFETHRNKGLGHAIELNLAKKIIRKGYKVFKCVELDNTAVLSRSSRSPHWTMAVDVDGKDVNFVFLIVTKK